MIKGRMNIVIGGQAGSESKGKLAHFLVKKFDIDGLVMSASPNAGHTVVVDGKKFVSYHLPVSAVGTNAPIFLTPASVIRVPVLLEELDKLGINRNRLYIDPMATIIRDHYLTVEKEKGLLKIGSTNQGVGVARRERVMRNPDVTFAKDVPDLSIFVLPGGVSQVINDAMDRGLTFLCEMTQGFDLCLVHGIDPICCTSKIIHPAMALAEMGVAPKMVGHTYGVFRPYPIRVNNREGNSGPYAEAAEITWTTVAGRCGAPHRLQELTTTTKLPRRVFEFSDERFGKFIQLCRPDHLCLQFVNYIEWDDYQAPTWRDLSDNTRNWVLDLEADHKVKVNYIGTSEELMIDRGMDK